MSQLPFQLLELNVISAQDLGSVSRKNLRTYAVAWINRDRKLRTRTDQQGQNNPTWNDKFVFRVDEKFLASETSAVMIEIYALGWLRDIPVGSVRVLVSNLIPPTLREQKKSTRRFVALQIRRASGRPQGILNMGVSLLDRSMRSMPLYTELSASAFGYYDLMGEKQDNHKQSSHKINNNGSEKKLGTKEEKGNNKIQLRRTQSDRTDLGNQNKGNNYNCKAGSVCNGSVLIHGSSTVDGPGQPAVGNGSMCSDAGPSPSIVAAAVAQGLYPVPTMVPPKPGSSILEDWTVAESSISAEGLQSKIDRWKMELPPLYNRLENQKIRSSGSGHRNARRRRHTDDGSGLFSCFGNAFGCEFTIVCGADDSRKNNRSRNNPFSPSELEYL